MVTYDQVMEPTLEVPQLELTAADRCDRCGAQAYHRATMPSGLELFFCNHDLRKHLSKLAEDEARVESDPRSEEIS